MKWHKPRRDQSRHSPQQPRQQTQGRSEYDQAYGRQAPPENQKTLPSHIAYTVTEGEDRNYWHKIGAAWMGNHDSIKLNLHATPVNGEIILQSRERLEQLREEKAQRQRHSQSNTHDPSQ